MNTADIEDIYELSPLQQGLLFHTLYSGDPDTYINQRSFLIDGPLDMDILVEAWKQAAGAHTALRTSFHWEGLDKPLQVVHRNVPVVINRHDWSGVDDDQHQERFDRLLAEDLAARFDPAVPPLQRLHLIQFGDRRFGFIWTHHLLLLDGWSVPIFMSDVVRRYLSLAVGAPPPPPVPLYRDYIAWLQRQDLDAAKDFWVDTMAGRAEPSPLGPLLPADPQGRAGTLDERSAKLPPPVEAGLRKLAAKHRVTLNSVLHAAWALVLQHYSGDAEVTFGVTSSARPPELPQVDTMVGLFTNTLPVPVTVPDDGDLGSWLRDIQARYVAIRRYEYTPLADIKQWVAPGPQPLFHSLVIFDNFPMSIEVGDDLSQRLSIRTVNAVEKTSQPLVVTATPEPAFTLGVRVHRERFVPGSAEEILGCFQTVLTAMVDAERISSIAAALQTAEEAGASTAVTYPDADRTLAGLIERQCRATPDATAVLTDDDALSYGELLARARRAAAALAATGVGPGQVVGVCAERSLDMVTGLLGTLLAGAAYLPLEPSLPAARLAFMLDDAGADVVLAQRDAAGAAHEAGARHVLTLDDLPDAPAGYTLPTPSGTDAAYVLYTSGSTGQPKGVVVTHAAIVNRLLWMQQTFPLTGDDRVMQKTPFGFDVSVWEFFWPLMTGAAMVLTRPGGHQDAEYLARTIVRQQVTTGHFVPSMLQLFLDEPAAASLPALRRVICSGEQLPYGLVQRFRELLPEVGLHNLYGPTEAAVDVTWWDCARPAPPDVIPIGDAIANTQAYVLDRRLMRVPRNVPGELYLGGVQLARGYLNRPGLTSATFVAHPLAGPGGRLYRTGDKVRRRSDGSLEFLGRLDQQVKIHGYRIELGEIEQILAGHPAVREAAVVVRERADGQQLAAYLTEAEDQDIDPQALRDYLQLQLPPYMLPATFTVLAAMPLTHNGKLDRAGLPDPFAAYSAENGTTGPATPREEAVAAVFRDILGLPDVDVTANFFELGGNSYDAVRAIRRIEGATVGLLGANPSVRALSAALEDDEDGQRMLLRLTEPGPVSHTLVCVPFGGGSAITYQQLARTLSPEIALLALSVPGHDVGGDPELRPLEEVAQECVEEVLKRADGPISVYGHCAGVAMAVEVVRRLEAADRPVDRLFLAASYPFYEAGAFGRTLQRGLAALVSKGVLRVSAMTVGTTENDSSSDLAEMRYLQSIGGFDGVVDDDALAFVMRAFRHDVTAASRYFSERWPPRNGDTPALEAPITFIAGTEDPLTPRFERRYRAWERFGMGVELVTVPGGGHYFHQQQPDVVATILEQRCFVPTVDRG